MAPADSLSPAGSSTYSSNTLYVGDGTWDSSRNTFLLPNLQGLNFDTMVYNGMGNRFASLDEYHVLITGHGVLAAIVFLFIYPASIMVMRFGRDASSSLRYHVYLNVTALFLATVVFMLGMFAVGPGRSLTNPHHGIGLTIYVLILVQTIGGTWVRSRLRRRSTRRGVPIKKMLHQWLGRAIALLGVVQVPLGLTLYGSPKFTFVLYTLWMTFLLVVYFILSHRAASDEEIYHHGTLVHDEKFVEERKSGGIGRWLVPLAAGGGLLALLNRRRSKRESGGSRAEVISSRRGSRRGSGSYIEEEKFEEEHHERGGLANKLIAGAALVGAGTVAKRWYDRRRDRDDEYSAVAPDTPSRRHRPRPGDSEISEESVDIRRHERRHGPILPGPGNPLDTATAISAATPRPVTPRPIGTTSGRRRRDSFSSDESDTTPSRRGGRESHVARNTVLGGIGLAWLAKKYKDRKDRQEQVRVDRIREQEIEDERRLESSRRHGALPPRFTGDGTPRRSGRATEITESDISSDLSSLADPRRRGPMPPLAAGAIPVAAGTAASQSRSRHDIIDPVPAPAMEPRQFHDSGSEAYFSTGGREHRRHHSRAGRAAEVATAAGLAAEVAEEEERRRRRERSRGGPSTDSPPVVVSLKPDRDRVTLRRLTEEEALAERSARANQSRRRVADSVSSPSGSETAASNRRYRRDQSARRDAAEAAAEQRVEAGSLLSPPRPAFAGGKQPKDSSYYSGAPPPPSAPESLGSPESHGTRSGMSPSVAGGPGIDHAERRRRRTIERNQRQATETVDFT